MATANDFTLTAASMTAGQSGSITFTRPSKQYALHSASVTFGAVTEPMALTVLSQSETKVVYGFTPPLYWCEDLPDAVSGTASMTAQVSFDSVIDALDDPHVCSLQSPFTVYVPESLRPTGTLETEMVYGNDVARQWGTALRGISRLRYAVTAQPAMGAAVTACTLRLGAQEQSGLQGELPPFTAPGEFQPVAHISDRRGRSAEVRGAEITVWDYYRPTLSGISVLRCSQNGNANSGGAYLKVRAVAKCAAVDGRNSVTLRVRIRPVGGTWGSFVTLTSGTAKILAASATAVYEAEFTAADALGSTNSVTALSGTAAVAFHLREGGDGAAFGKRAPSEGLHCAWDAHFDGAVTASGKVTAGSLQVGGKSLLDLTYPVGSVYMSFSATSPATLFGGTWSKIEGLFLMGADKNHVANTIGGAAAHTLKVSELPAHSHRVLGYADAENVGHSHTVPNIRTGTGGEYSAYAETWGNGSGSRDLSTDFTDITHNHRVDITSQTTGSGAAISLLPPYMAVNMWRRTA